MRCSARALMRSALDGIRSASGGRVPKWSPALPRAARALPRRERAARRRRERIVYFPSCAARTMGAQRGDDEVEALPIVAERLFAQGGLRRRLSGAAGRALLRPAVREQGPVRRGRSQVGGARSGAARRVSENGRLADRVRHEPVRLPDEALSRGPARGAGQHRVHPRSRAAARRRRADARAGRDPSGVQRAQDGHRRQARGDRARVQRRGRRRSTTSCAAASPATRASTARSSTSMRCAT